jgi:hypothetical protein
MVTIRFPERTLWDYFRARHSIAAARSPAEISKFTRVAADVIEQLQALSGGVAQPSTATV